MSYVLSDAENVKELEVLAAKPNKRTAHPSRLSLSPVIESKDSFSFPEDEKEARKNIKIAKVFCSFSYLL